MQVDLPFVVEYETPNMVPIDEIIDSLISIKMLLEEGSGNLPHFVRGLSVDQVQVYMRTISQESPLREVLLVSLFLAFQKNLEDEVPEVIQKITGTHVPDQFHTLVTVLVLIAIFYGAAYVKDIVAATHQNSHVRRQLNSLVAELAQITGMAENEIRKFLEERYKTEGRIKVLANAAIGFFRPSKSQSNSPIRIGDRQIDSNLVSDVPVGYAYEESLGTEGAREFHAVDLELHAQDRDKGKTGWAAIPKGISDKRLKMRLVDGVNPGDLWGKNQVKGDIIIKYKRVGLDMVPTEIHLRRVTR
jgi:hypothetical protein